ncbi:uncharacterized protein [Centruroides vittatus]|uniref:uncharacterized protein n=1 Tax=Centruroides vittatus TaxID=120091 RepID=UPI00350E9782
MEANMTSNNECDVESLTPADSSDANIRVEQQKPVPKGNLLTRICRVLTKWERVYMIATLAFLSTIWSLAASISYYKSSALEWALVYTATFCLYYVIHGVLAKKAFALIGFVVLILLILAYGIINYVSDSSDDLKLVFLIFVCVLGPVFIVASLRFSYRYYSSGIILQYVVGANDYLQSLCKTMMLCKTLLVFDFHMQVNLVLLIARNGSDAVHSDKIVLALTFIFIAIGNRSIIYEKKVLVFLFLIISISQPVFTIYIFHVAKRQFKVHHAQYVAIYLVGGLGLVAWLSSVICIGFVTKNFGKGLKEKVNAVSNIL